MFKTIAFTVLFISTVTVSIHVVWDNYKVAQSMYLAESKCVAQLISKGIERRDIDTLSGTCFIK